MREKAITMVRTAGEVWQVWYTWLANHVEFYMTVNDNKVTSVYDYSISLIGRLSSEPVW